ncbi:MAG: DUF2490 domain-containing protein [Saprospiraceae bacterium]|nr:DUF2490 domain-containing protein [Saprospiraceae bacterium]
MMRKGYITLMVCLGGILFISNNSLAQKVGSWNIFHLRYNVNSKIGFILEGQIRSLAFFNNFHYHEYRGGLVYSPNEFITFNLSVGDYDTYMENGNFSNPKINDEFRLWEQVQLNTKVGRVKFEQRLRLEQRFAPERYRNRLRYRVMAYFPLNKSKESQHPWFIYVGDELFFTDIPTYFERNRFSTGIQYKLNDHITLSTGYLRQFDYKIDDENGQDFCNPRSNTSGRLWTHNACLL